MASGGPERETDCLWFGSQWLSAADESHSFDPICFFRASMRNGLVLSCVLYSFKKSTVS